MTRVWLCTMNVGLVVVALLVPSGGARADSYNLMGYEGVPTLGAGGFTLGTPPPVGDYATTLCRYIDVVNTTVGHYYLRYFLDLPDGATITGVSLRIADYNPTGVMYAYLRSRPWNSRDGGTTEAFTLTDNNSNRDKLVSMGTLNLTVNNDTTEYWIDLTPQNSALPGQLCVYSIHLTYN